MMNEKEFSMMDAFIALNELDDDSVESMVKPRSKKESSRAIHEGKGYSLSGSKDTLEAAKSFLRENDEVALEVIDPDADTLEHIKDRIDYVGQMILRCNRCHANRFIDMEALVESEDGEDIYNMDDECPNCKTSGIGYEIVGQVGKYEQAKEATSDVSAESDSAEVDTETEESDAADVAVENDELNPDELKFDNDETLSDESDESSEVEQPAENETDEVTDTTVEEEEEPDMLETSTSEDDEDNIEVEEDEEEDEEVKESLYKPALYEDADKAAENEKEALMYDKIMNQMASDKVSDEWVRIWNNYKGKVKNLSTPEIVDLKYDFCELYEKYHNEGLLAAEKDVLDACTKLDKELGLAKIENHRMYVESVQVAANTTISEVLGSLLDADKVGKIEITNKCDDKEDEKVYDGDYNNLPLNIANVACTGFDVNNRTLACNIDQDEAHGRRPLSDILGKFTDDKSDNIHLYDIASSEEIFKGKKSDAIDKFGGCGFISIDTPAVIRMTICDPSIVSQVAKFDKDAEDKLIEHIIAENDLSITRIDAPYSNEFWIRECVKSREDLSLIYEAYVKPLGSDLMSEFKAVTGYYNALDEAFEAGYRAAKKDESLDEGIFSKILDKPASIETQQAWEDEMTDIKVELGYGNPSERRKAKLNKRHDALANKFARQRDIEARNAAQNAEADLEPAAVSEALFDPSWLETGVEAGEITQEDADKAANINFDINGEDVILFIQETPISLESIKSVTYGDDVDSYDGTYEVTLTDDTTQVLGWKDYDDKLYPVTEAFIGRDQMISELKQLGKNYYFDKYSDAQIFRIWQKEKAKAAQKAAPVEPESPTTCEQCGGRLNDGGTCPKCDDGEEDISERLNENADLTLSQIVSDSIHHMISDLGYDSADEEFPDDVLADIENNYNVDVPDDPEGYRIWAGDVFEEISRQLNSLEESISESVEDDEFDDWVDDEIDPITDEAPMIDSETLKQIVTDEMPRAIKECGKKLRDIVAYFMSILPETDLGEVDQKELKAIITTYLENNVDAADVAEQFQSFKSRKDLAAAITECKNNSKPYTVRRSIKEGYRYDLLVEANESEESEETISDEEVAAHEDEVKNYSKDNKEKISKADGEEVMDKLADASSYTEFVKILNKDRKSKAFLQYLRQHYKTGDDEIATVKASGASTALVECSTLIPTQQNISLDKSLGMIKAGKSGWAVNIINNPATAFDDPTITYAGKYIIDGHHRWSKAYALVGPDAKIKVINFPAIEGVTWKDMLKAAQLAIVAKNPGGDLIHKVGNDNMLADTSGQAAADYYVDNADDKVVEAMKAKGFGDDKEAQGEHVKKNVAVMASTGVVSGAAPRAVMPQTDTAPGSVDLLKSAVIDLTEGDNLPVPAEDTSLALTAEEAEVNANIMRISQDIAQSIHDVYGIDADPALIVADILQDLGLIAGTVRPEDLEDTALNRVTLDMYRDHEMFWEFMDDLVLAITGESINATPEQKIKRAVKMLASPNFSRESIRAGIESRQFQMLVDRGQVPFIPAGTQALLEEVEDIDVNTEKFDAEMNEYFNEAYDETVLYTTTSGSVDCEGRIVLEGVLQTEDLSTDVTFTLKPESPINESLGDALDVKSMLESLTYDVTNNISEEVFKFKFSE